MIHQSLLNYLGFMAVSVGLLVAALAVYLQVTPYSEIKLIRAGNRAAAFSFGGTAIGLALTLYGVGTSTWRVMDLAIWGGIGLVFQIIAFFVVAALLGGFKAGIEEDKVGYGIALGCLSVAIGILNSAALSA
jgi:putative membrane protein